MSDPAVKNMNETQWTFELTGLVERDNRKYNDISSIMKTSRDSLVNLLGLNLMPIEEDLVDDQGESFKRLRRPEEDEIMPLSLMCANETLLSELSKLNNELNNQELTDAKIESGELVEMSPDELDNFMDEDDEGDIVFGTPMEREKHLKWNSKETKNILKHMVAPLEDKDKDLIKPDVIEGDRKEPSRLVVK